MIKSLKFLLMFKQPGKSCNILVYMVGGSFSLNFLSGVKVIIVYMLYYLQITHDALQICKIPKERLLLLVY